MPSALVAGVLSEAGDVSQVWVPFALVAEVLSDAGDVSQVRVPSA